MCACCNIINTIYNEILGLKLKWPPELNHSLFTTMENKVFTPVPNIGMIDNQWSLYTDIAWRGIGQL